MPPKYLRLEMIKWLAFDYHTKKKTFSNLIKTCKTVSQGTLDQQLDR